MTPNKYYLWKARWQAGMQQAAERWCTDLLSFSMQRMLALQTPHPGALRLESTLPQGQRMRKREQSKEPGHLHLCVCTCVCNSHGCTPTKHHLVHLVRLMQLPRSVHMYLSACTKSHSHSLSGSLSEHVLGMVPFSDRTGPSARGVNKAGTICVHGHSYACTYWRMVW